MSSPPRPAVAGDSHLAGHANALAQPYPSYPPSWIDRFTGWTQRLPFPAWLCYLVLGLTLALTRTIVGWSDGSYPVGTFLPVHLLLASVGVYILFLLYYLDDKAGEALADFRPVLMMDDAGYERLRYQLTTMPARPTLMWSLVGLAFGVASSFTVYATTVQSSKLFTSLTASVVDYVLCFGFVWTMAVVFAYHTIRQLRLVSRIYTQHTNVSIFETGPLYALSRVTALSAITLFSLPYLSVTFGPATQRAGGADAFDVISAALFTLFAVAAFIWPLLGAHRLLQAEKARRKSEVSRELEAVTDDLHRRTRARDYSDMAGINDATESLVRERDVLDKVSTWPWEPETVRVVGTALLLPIVLWAITRVLERLGF